MTIQIAVRLHDDMVSYLDAQVASGRARSRAQLIGYLVAREARRQRAVEDIEIMKRAGAMGYPDLAGIAEATAYRPLDLD